jgi:hypothetical protein
MEFGQAPFGLNEVKLVSTDGLTIVSLDAPQTMGFTPRVLTDELKGGDKLIATATVPEALEWSIEEGGLPIAAIALITGWTASASGTTPHQKNTLTAHAGVAFPYFQIYGKVLGSEGSDDLHIKIPRAKITKPPEGDFAYGKFKITKLAGIAVEDSVHGLFQLVANETTVALETAF